MKKTFAEVEALKENWKNDPCWDIEETEGFEEYYDELLLFRRNTEKEWETEYRQLLVEKASTIGCPGNTVLAQYVLSLESRIEKLEKNNQ